MQTEFSFLAAFIVGFLGGVHCLGMCGGIVGALTLGVDGAQLNRQARQFQFQMAYNAGRIMSYCLAGAIAGLLGYLALDLAGLHRAQQWLQMVAGLFMLALGLFLGGWWKGLAHLEQWGTVIWKRIEPLGKRLIPIQSPAQAFALGLVWGWLPCGLVYSVLIWSFAAGGLFDGALLMLGFGLGTLPNLLLMGMFAVRVRNFARMRWVSSLAGLLVMLLGAYMIWLSITA